jgi:hypothetical protein
VDASTSSSSFSENMKNHYKLLLEEMNQKLGHDPIPPTSWTVPGVDRVSLRELYLERLKKEGKLTVELEALFSNSK